MANTIFSGDRVRALRAALQLNTAATIASGAVDPTSVAPGISLAVGSIYLSTSTGKIYNKHTTSGNDTNFYEVTTSDSIAALAADVADLITLSGVAANSTDLGTFSGTTIPDNSDIKEALQALETEVETKADDADVIKKDGSVDFTADQSMAGFKLTDLAAPTDPNDAARKAYVDSEVSSVSTDVDDLISLSGVAANSTNLGTFTGTTIPDSSTVKAALQALETEVELKLDASEKGAALGVATLDAGGKVPVSQLPNSVMEYLGTWAASTNTPTLADGVGNAGDVYIASDAGTVNFGSGNITFAAGDWVIYDGAIWQKSVNSNAVVSVNGYTGVVVLDTDDVSEATNLYFTETRVLSTDLAGFVSGAGSVSAADSVLEAIQKLDGNNLETQTDVDDLVALSGVAINSTDLGTFTGTTIPDNSDIKEALQALETEVENKANVALDNLASTAVNTDILPDSSGTRDLGSFANSWQETWTAQVIHPGNGFVGTALATGSNNSALEVLSTGSVVDGTSGELVARSGNVSGAGSSGPATLRSGNLVDVNASGNSGAITVRSGNVSGASSTGNSGNVVVRSGDTVDGNSGTVTVTAGNVTGSGTRGGVVISGNGVTIDSLGAGISASGDNITNVANPVGAQDAATKAYVDAAVSGGGGATTELDNLTTTAVNAAINPDTDDTHTLGTASLQWSEIHAVEGKFENIAVALSSGTAEVKLASDSLTDRLDIQYDTASQSGAMSLNGTGDLSISTSAGDINLTAGSGIVDVNTAAIKNVVDPTSAQDAATKAYVDSSSALGSSNLTLTTGGTITANNTSTHQVIIVQANSAGTTVLSTVPFGSGSAKDGQLITLIGNSSTNLVQIDNNDGAKGCVMNASWVGGQYDSITFLYSDTLDRYVEIARNN